MKATGWKDSQKIKNRMTEVLLLVGLDDAMTKMPHQLSGGEQQRVVIARALINNPSILLADEPTGNLDPEVADGIFKLFQEINKKGTAILMATHNHELLRKYPYRVLKCEKGELLDSQTHDVSFGYSFLIQNLSWINQSNSEYLRYKVLKPILYAQKPEIQHAFDFDDCSFKLEL